MAKAGSRGGRHLALRRRKAEYGDEGERTFLEGRAPTREISIAEEHDYRFQDITPRPHHLA